MTTQLGELIGSVKELVQTGTIKIQPSMNLGQKIIMSIFLALLLGIILAIIYLRLGSPSPLWIFAAMIILAILIFIVLNKF